MSLTLNYTDDFNETKSMNTVSEFNIVMSSDGTSYDLNEANSLSIKVGNSEGYISEIPIDVDSIESKENGIVNVKLDDTFMKNFPPDIYHLEIWVGTNKGRLIFPSAGVLPFTINGNIMSNIETVSTITLYQFQDDFDDLKKIIMNNKAYLDKELTTQVDRATKLKNDFANETIEKQKNFDDDLKYARQNIENKKSEVQSYVDTASNNAKNDLIAYSTGKQNDVNITVNNAKSDLTNFSSVRQNEINNRINELKNTINIQQRQYQENIGDLNQDVENHKASYSNLHDETKSLLNQLRANENSVHASVEDINTARRESVEKSNDAQNKAVQQSAEYTNSKYASLQNEFKNKADNLNNDISGVSEKIDNLNNFDYKATNLVNSSNDNTTAPGGPIGYSPVIDTVKLEKGKRYCVSAIINGGANGNDLAITENADDTDGYKQNLTDHGWYREYITMFSFIAQKSGTHYMKLLRGPSDYNNWGYYKRLCVTQSEDYIPFEIAQKNRERLNQSGILSTVENKTDDLLGNISDLNNQFNNHYTKEQTDNKINDIVPKIPKVNNYKDASINKRILAQDLPALIDDTYNQQFHLNTPQGFSNDVQSIVPNYDENGDISYWDIYYLYAPDPISSPGHTEWYHVMTKDFKSFYLKNNDNPTSVDNIAIPDPLIKDRTTGKEYDVVDEQQGKIPWSAVATGSVLNNEGILKQDTYGRYIDKNAKLAYFTTFQNGNQEMYLAYSNYGEQFKAFQDRPVVEPSRFPYDFRDPCVVHNRKLGHDLVAYLAGGPSEKIYVLTSPDGVNWNHAAGDDIYTGSMTECPVVKEINGVPILFFGAGIHTAYSTTGTEALNGHYDSNGLFKTDSSTQDIRLDQGFDFYAGNFEQLDKDTIVALSWIDNWGYSPIGGSVSTKHFGSYSLPRKITSPSNGSYKIQPIEPDFSLQSTTNVSSGEKYDIGNVTKIEISSNETINGLFLFQGDDGSNVTLDINNGTNFMRYNPDSKMISAQYSALVPGNKMVVYFDTTSVEVYYPEIDRMFTAANYNRMSSKPLSYSFVPPMNCTIKKYKLSSEINNQSIQSYVQSYVNEKNNELSKYMNTTINNKIDNGVSRSIEQANQSTNKLSNLVNSKQDKADIGTVENGYNLDGFTWYANLALNKVNLSTLGANLGLDMNYTEFWGYLAVRPGYNAVYQYLYDNLGNQWYRTNGQMWHKIATQDDIQKLARQSWRELTVEFNDTPGISKSDKTAANSATVICKIDWSNNQAIILGSVTATTGTITIYSQNDFKFNGSFSSMYEQGSHGVANPNSNGDLVWRISPTFTGQNAYGMVYYKPVYLLFNKSSYVSTANNSYSGYYSQGFGYATIPITPK